MPYDHTKPEIAAAYEAYRSAFEQTSEACQLSDPAVGTAYGAYLRTLEIDGQLNVSTFEMELPPQLAEKCGFRIIVVPLNKIINWLISEMEVEGDFAGANIYRETILALLS